MMPLYTCAFEASQTERVEVVELDFVLALSTQCENSLLLYSVVNFVIKASKTTLISRTDLHKDSLHPLNTGRQ